jgi:large subunit ribosomal protein L15e
MRAHNYIMQNFQKSYFERNEEYRKRLHEWRGQNAICITPKPTNIARARQLGYKAKESYIIARVRIGRGRRKRRTPSGGRKPGQNILFLSPGTSLQAQAEVRAARKFPPLEVLNSYWVGQDGNYKYFEVILVDAKREPSLRIRKGRAFRGLTHMGRKHRGIARA